MATNATITLRNLHCNLESNDSGHSEPYIWPVLLWIDDSTLMTDDLVGVIAPAQGNARIVIKSNMSAGETADIPLLVGMLGVHFEDSLTIRQLLLAVALWEADETPEAAIIAGYHSFASELRAALADKLFDFSAADDAEKKKLIDEIKARVKSKVSSAIRNALSPWEKARVLIGTLDLDDLIGGDFRYFPDVTPGNVSLAFSDDPSNSYTIEGVLDITTPPIEHCPVDVARVKAAQGEADTIDAHISNLQTRLQHAGPQEKPRLIAQISQLSEELSIAMEALEDARRALQGCRDLWSRSRTVKTTTTTVLGA